MILRFINFLFDSKNKHSLLVLNFWNQLINNGLNIIAPAITLGYTFSIIGANNFAFISFSTAIIGFLSYIVEYGLITSAVRTVAVKNENSGFLSNYASATITIKMVICSILIVALFVFFNVVDRFNDFKPAIWCSLGLLISQVFNVNFFFLGLQENRLFAKINLISKLVSTFLVLWLINKSDDYLVFLLINSGISIITSLVSLIFIFTKFKLRLTSPNVNLILEILKEGFHVFISNLSGCIWIYGPTFLLSLLVGNTILGYYGLADRLSNIVVVVFMSVAQVIMPNLALFNSSNDTVQLKKYFDSIFKYASILLALGYVLFYFSIDSLLVLGSNISLDPISQILKIAGFYTAFLCLSTLLQPFLLSLHLDKKLSKIYMIFALLFFVNLTILYFLKADISILLFSISIFHILIFLLLFSTVHRTLKSRNITSNIDVS